MTLDEARKGLFDERFMLGGMRRRAAIKYLLKLPDPAGVLVLAEALGDFFCFNVSHEAVLVRLTNEITNAGCRGHGLLSKGAMGLNLFG